jgi:hypothetical protein
MNMLVSSHVLRSVFVFQFIFSGHAPPFYLYMLLSLIVRHFRRHAIRRRAHRVHRASLDCGDLHGENPMPHESGAEQSERARGQGACAILCECERELYIWRLCLYVPSLYGFSLCVPLSLCLSLSLSLSLPLYVFTYEDYFYLSLPLPFSNPTFSLTNSLSPHMHALTHTDSHVCSHTLTWTHTLSGARHSHRGRVGSLRGERGRGLCHSADRTAKSRRCGRRRISRS